MIKVLIVLFSLMLAGCASQHKVSALSGNTWKVTVYEATALGQGINEVRTARAKNRLLAAYVAQEMQCERYKQVSDSNNENTTGNVYLSEMTFKCSGRGDLITEEQIVIGEAVFGSLR